MTSERKLSLEDVTILHDKKYRCKVYRKNGGSPQVVKRWTRITANAYGKDGDLDSLPEFIKLKPGSLIICLDRGR
jgi:hypothetical protein